MGIVVFVFPSTGGQSYAVVAGMRFFFLVGSEFQDSPSCAMK
jgi:hypothetical protein